MIQTILEAMISLLKTRRFEGNMIMRIENTTVSDMLMAFYGMRFSHSSESRGDSFRRFDMSVEVGPDDLALAQRLVKAGPDHGKFMRFIHVQAIVRAPLNWWKHFDTYKYAEKLSGSTMHTLMKRELTAEDFTPETDPRSIQIVNKKIAAGDFQAAVDSLPDGFIQKRMIDANYACLRNIYFQRRNHKLPIWHEFCSWIESLPLGKELITIEKE